MKDDFVLQNVLQNEPTDTESKEDLCNRFRKSKFDLDKQKFLEAFYTYLQPHMAKRRLKEIENKISADFAKIQGYDPYKLMEFLKSLAENLLKGFIIGNYLKTTVKEAKASKELFYAQNVFKYVTSDDPKAYINLIKSELSEDDLRLIDIFKKFTRGGLQSLTAKDVDFIFSLKKELELQSKIAKKEKFSE